MANISLNSKTYTANGVINQIASWIERSLGIAKGFSALTASVMMKPTISTVMWKMVVPVIQTDPDACACPGEELRSTIVDVKVRFGASATAAERADVLARIQDLVLTTAFADSVSSLVTPNP